MIKFRDFLFTKTDDLNWHVEQEHIISRSKKPEKNGTAKLESVGWYSSLGAACLDVAHLLADTETEAAKDLEEYATRLKRIGAEIVQAVNAGEK